MSLKLTLTLLIAVVTIFNFYTACALANDALISAVEISASALKAQSERIKVISQNLANEDSTGNGPGSKPYQRKTIIFKRKKDHRNNIEKIQKVIIGADKSEFRKKYDPTHPAADNEGYVLYPNVDKLIEMTDAKEAQRSYEANLNAIEISKSMMKSTLEILR